MSEAEERGTGAGQLWGARFASGPSDALTRLSRSTHFDWRLAPYDLAGSAAHAKALAAAGYLTPEELAALEAGIDRLRGGVDDGSQLVVVAVELVHHQRAVAVADQAVHELGDGASQRRFVVARQQVHRHGRPSSHRRGSGGP